MRIQLLAFGLLAFDLNGSIGMAEAYRRRKERSFSKDHRPLTIHQPHAQPKL